MSGAPRSAFYDAERFIRITRDAVEGLGDYTTAGVWQHIVFRCRAARSGGVYRATYKKLAEETWLTVEQVRRAVGVMRDRGWVVVTQTDSLNKTFTYQPIWNDESDPTPSGENPTPVWAEPHVGVGFPPLLPLYKEEEEEEEKNPHTPIVEGEVLDDLPVVAAPVVEFSKVWLQWPRRVGKAAALKAWEKATKGSDPGDILEALVSDAEAYATYPKAEASRIPHLATWLNGRRWEDEERQAPWVQRNGTSLRAKADAEIDHGLRQAEVFRQADTPNDIIRVALRTGQIDNLEAAVQRGLNQGMTPDQMNTELRQWLAKVEAKEGASR